MLRSTCMVYICHFVMSINSDLQFIPVSSMAKILLAAFCASFAGGRNVTVGLRSHSGYFRRTSVVALAIFSQYWYWYPLSYFLTLTLQPTALLGLNSDLQMPKLQVSCLSASFARPVCMHPSHTVLHDCTFGQEVQLMHLCSASESYSKLSLVKAAYQWWQYQVDVMCC